jgi:RHS repeat-associated protein
MNRILFFLFCILSFSSIHAFECHNNYENYEFSKKDLINVDIDIKDEKINEDKDQTFSKPLYKTLSEKDIPDSNNAMATLESGPSAIVAGCVNAITGDFLESHLVITVPGAMPLTVQCNYCSSEKKWNFTHMPLLKAGGSKGENHFYACYFDDSGSGITYRAYCDKKKVKNSILNIPKRVFKKGLTNCGSGRICGMTNWRNSYVSMCNIDNIDGYKLILASGVKRYFIPENKIKNGTEAENFKWAPVGKFRLYWECHPDGNSLDYRYEKNKLALVKAISNSGKKLSELSIIRDQNSKKILNWISSSGSARIIFNDSKEKRVNKILPSHAVCLSYEYNKEKLLTKKIFPEGRFLKINYHLSGKEKRRVSHLITPNGISYYFKYDLDGATNVFDAEGHITTYTYSKKTKRLQHVKRYHQRKYLLSQDNFYWSSNGNLLARSFEGDGKTHFSRFLEYDACDNVKEDRLYGNLTGNHSQSIKFLGYFPTGAYDEYVKKYLYSQDGTNLLLIENDGTRVTYFDYYPNRLLKARYTSDGNKILKREFFEYDENGVMTAIIWDDGQATLKDDLSFVTERHIKIITPRTIHPIGLPNTVHEYYMDMASHQYCLLKMIAYTHSPYGKVTQEDHYGSDGNFTYSLKWEYDNLGNITKQIDSLNQATVYHYDGNSNKIFEQGPLPGWHKEFTYDLCNNLHEEKEFWPDGTILTTTHSYNKLNQRISTINPQGHETTFTYDALGRVIKTQYPALFVGPEAIVIPSNETEYDAMGNAIIQKDANGDITKSAYTVRGQPYRIEFPDGSVEQKIYSLSGLLIKEIAKNGLTTEYTYDFLDRIKTTIISDPQGNVLKTKSASYSTFHLLTETDEEGITTTYEYDGAGRRIAIRKGNCLTQYQYDALGRLIKTIDHIDEKETCVTCKVYDLLDRVIEERIEDGSGKVFSKEQYSYDVNGNRTSITIFNEAGNATTLTEYTPDGKPLLITDALGNQTRFKYDHEFSYKGQKVFSSTKTDSLGYRETIIYDTHGNICWEAKADAFYRVIQEEISYYDLHNNKTLSQNNVYEEFEQKRTIETTWKYNSMGDLICSVEAENTPERRVISHHYNSYGQKEKTDMPNGVSIIYEYDSLGRLSSYQSTDNTIDYQYIYDKQDHLILIKDLIHETATERFYDLHGNLLSETLDNGLTLTYTYDKIDRLLSVTLPDQSSIHYCYNAKRLLAIERIKNGEIAYTHHYPKYDLAGNVLEETLLGNAGSIQYKYDLLQRPISIHAPYWQEIIPPNGFDAVGNLLKREILDEHGALTYSYAYDSLNQLILEDGFVLHAYKNDSVYNRTSKDNQPYELNFLNQLKSQTNYLYHYDNNGNLKEKTSDSNKIKYTYDALDRLIEVQNDSEITSYTYDSFHRRLSKKQNGRTIHYLYHDQNEIGAVLDGKITQFRVLGLSQGAEIGGAVAFELSDKNYAPIHDPQGNIVALIDSSGQLIESYRYTAFGETKAFSNASVDNPWRFSSKRFDPETGFTYFGRRYYDSETGRWITPDPAGYADGPNLYAYVHNKPLIYIDPDGRFAFALPLFNMALSHCFSNNCIPGAMAHGAFDFAMSNVHALEQGAMFIGCDDVGYGPEQKIGMFNNLLQQQNERMDALGDFIMNVQGISHDNSHYNSIRHSTTTTLEVASLVVGGYSLGKSAYNLYRGGTGLAQAGSTTYAKLSSLSANKTLVNGKSSLATSSKSGADLARHLNYLQKYGKKDVKFLQNGRIRYYGEIDPPKVPREMVGIRYVHEFNPLKGSSRGWMETLDSSSRIRQVRPQMKSRHKTHYLFDENGNLDKTW